LRGVVGGGGSPTRQKGGARRRAQVHMQHVGFGGSGRGSGRESGRGSGRRGGLGSLVGSLVGAWGGVVGARGGGRGGGVPVRGSTSGRHPRSPATQSNRNFTLTQTALRAREPRARTQNRHSSESKDENSISNHRLGQFRISASLSRYFKPTQIFARIRPAALQASLRALTSHSTAAGRSGFEQPETGDLASNNLRDKRRTINTRPSLKPVKRKCAVVT
jgi:hypothetical protein